MKSRNMRALIERAAVRILDSNRAFAIAHPHLKSETRDENRRLYRYLRTLA